MCEKIDFAREFFNRDRLLPGFARSQKNSDEDRILDMEALKRAAEHPDTADTNDHDTLVLWAAGRLRAGLELPDWLAIFTADVLEGKRKRPTKRGKDKYDYWERDFKLMLTAKEVAKRFDMPLYTNNESSSKTTAAYITAKAAKVGVDVVKNAIKRFKNHWNTGVE